MPGTKLIDAAQETNREGLTGGQVIAHMPCTGDLLNHVRLPRRIDAARNVKIELNL